MVKQTKKSSFRYRDASDNNWAILEGMSEPEARREFIEYLRDYEQTIFWPRPVEHATFAELLKNDPEIRSYLEQEQDATLVAEILCRRYPHLFFSIDHVFQVFTDWKIQWTKQCGHKGMPPPEPLPIPAHLVEALEDRALEMLVRRRFRKVIKALNRNPEQALKRMRDDLRKEKNRKRRQLLRHMIRISTRFLKDTYPEFVSELVPGKPFPSVHVRHWVRQIMERKNALIVGDVGTQKTSAAVVGLEKLNCRRVVVCCRSYARGMWANEIRRYYRNPPKSFIVNSVRDLRTLESMATEEREAYRFIIVGYGHVQIGQIDLDDENGDAYGERVVDALIRLKPDGVIVDEAHAIKGNGCRSERVIRIAQCKSVRHRVMLTATPFENAPNELAQLAPLLSPKKYPVPQAFLAECRNNPRIFFGIMTSRMCDYFSQEDVLDLPPTNVSLYDFFPVVKLPCPPDMLGVLEAIRNDGELEVRQQVQRMTRFLSVPSAGRSWYPKLRREPCFRDPLANPKIAYLKRETARRIKTGKVVIASGIYAAGITRELEEACEDDDIHEIAALFEEWFPGKVLRIDGAMNRNGNGTREEVQERWRNDSDARILIASVPASSESLNFSLKRKRGKVERMTIFYLSLPWKPTQYLQFNGRFRRPGSEVPLEVYTLIVEGTADEALLELNERKWRNFLIGVHGIPLQFDEEEALNRTTFRKIVATPGQWLRDAFMRMMGMGEARIQAFLKGKFKDLPVAQTMAEYYLETEEYGTAGHVSRVLVPMLRLWKDRGIISDWERVLDAGSGPLMLERKLSAPLHALDINPLMIRIGSTHSALKGKNAIVGRASHMPKKWDGHFSFVVASLLLDLTRKGAGKRGKGQASERVQVLLELHRVLSYGGLVWMTMQDHCFDNESLDAFVSAMESYGFEPVTPWTNRIVATDHKSHSFGFWSILVRKVSEPDEKLPCPVFLYEQSRKGTPRRRGKGKAKVPTEQPQPVLLRHEQFAICERNGELVATDTAAKQLSALWVNPTELYRVIAGRFGIAKSKKADALLKSQLIRHKPQSLNQMKAIWRRIREAPGVPRISWSDLAALLRPILAKR